MPFAPLRYSLPLLALTLTACSAGDIVESCEPMGPVTPLCGAVMPEDLEPLPEAGGILVSEYGDGGNTTGALSWLALGGSGHSFTRLIDSGSITSGANEHNWGDAECVAPKTLSPHGIHLSSRADKDQLLVVNHSEHEQVLFYEVIQERAEKLPSPTLAWRGCVTFPEHAVLNDVAALPGGGFAVTHMYDRGSTLLELGSMLGFNDGHVWRWSPNKPLHIIAGSKARLPNGIEVAADGKTLWVNNYIAQELRQYDVATDSLLLTVDVPNIDNSAWLPDGRLLLASHLSPISMGNCFALEKGSCSSPYALVAVNTQTGETDTLYTSQEGEPFGPATVAVPYKGKLYAGSFSGDRVAVIEVDF